MGSFSQGGVLSATLQEITDTKLDELSKRRSDYEKSKATVLASLQDETNPLRRLHILSQGVKLCFGIHTLTSGKISTGFSKHPDLEHELQHIDGFLSQAHYDPSISLQMMTKWEKSLLNHLNQRSLKFQYASLYAQLVTEWLSAEKPDSKDEEDVKMSDGFEDVTQGMKRDSRLEWEKKVFEPAGVDASGLLAYLDRLFGMNEAANRARKKGMAQVRSRVESFQRTMDSPTQFTPYTVGWAVDGLLASDLLTEEKRDVLRDFKGNSIILNEVADVLNMRMGALDSWSWGESVPLEQRRKITGVYNITMHEDLLQAIFLQYIGVKWSVFLKQNLKGFRTFTLAWKSSASPISMVEAKRRGYYLGNENWAGSVQRMRDNLYHKHYFVTQLMDSEQQRDVSAEGEEEAHIFQMDQAVMTQQAQQPRAMPQQMQPQVSGYMPGRPAGKAPRKQLASKAARRSAPNEQFRHGKLKRARIDNHYADGELDSEEDLDEDYDDDDDNGPAVKRPMDAKQRLLRLLSAEMAINTKIHGEMTAFHSTFDTWFSSLPHETILTMLSFLGVSNKWIDFFGRFLRAPLKFIEDDESAAPRMRRRGTPASHVLSEVFSETVLFFLDFAINQGTRGGKLHRIGDDFWFWSRSHATAVQAWTIVQEFTHITGTKVAPEKSGTVRVADHGAGNTGAAANQTSRTLLPVDASLPQGDIRWGFLRLTPQSGRFEIDQAMVDRHIIDLRRQLQDKRRSIISLVQAWNTYAVTFFGANFGRPAHCFGRDHIDQMLATHARVQRALFSPDSPHCLPLEAPKQRKPSSDSSKEPTGQEATAQPQPQPLANPSIVDFIKHLLTSRFSSDDHLASSTSIPDAFLLFPTSLGGLELKSPFISTLQVRPSVLQQPLKLLDDFFAAERESYLSAKLAFQSEREGKTVIDRSSLTDPHWKPETPEEASTFFPFEEYVRFREDSNPDPSDPGGISRPTLRHVFAKLLGTPEEEGLERAGVEVQAGLSKLVSEGGVLRHRHNMHGGTGGIHENWHAMEPYWRWVAQMYGPEVLDRFGGFTIVEPGLLPMGMVQLFRDKRMKWQD